jgi:hypothetical protein
MSLNESLINVKMFFDLNLLKNNLTLLIVEFDLVLAKLNKFKFILKGVPTHLPLNTHQPTLQVQSTPSSPLNPSIQTLPSLEFTINSQQINNCYSVVGNMLNGTNMYRSASNSNGLNGAGGESLPPSPQSQQSCFNSPQGSPGPLSISQQYLNPFTSNNYDIMQKKFDSINLDASNSASFAANQYAAAVYNQSALVPPPSAALYQQQQQQQQQQQNKNGLMNNKPDSSDSLNSNNTNINNNGVHHNNGMNGNNGNGNNSSTSNNSPNSIDNDIGANQIINSRSGSLSSNGSGGPNQLTNNGLYDNDLDLQNISSQYQQNHNNQQQHTTNGNQTNNPIINKTHKNSIPNIILTYSGGKCLLYYYHFMAEFEFIEF